MRTRTIVSYLFPMLSGYVEAVRLGRIMLAPAGDDDADLEAVETELESLRYSDGTYDEADVTVHIAEVMVRQIARNRCLSDWSLESFYPNRFSQQRRYYRKLTRFLMFRTVTRVKFIHDFMRRGGDLKLPDCKAPFELLFGWLPQEERLPKDPEAFIRAIDELLVFVQRAKEARDSGDFTLNPATDDTAGRVVGSDLKLIILAGATENPFEELAADLQAERDLCLEFFYDQQRAA